MPKGVRGWTIEERLMDKIKVDEHTSCWEWQAGKNNIGYGMIRISHKEGMMTAHKTMYETHTNTKVPASKVVMHTCSNYGCVNPDHLVLATRQDVSDLIKVNGRRPTHNRVKGTYRSCIYCGLFTSLALLARWHDDKCKKNPNA